MGRRPKLTPEQQAVIRETLEKGTYTTAQLARIYGVSHPMIQKYLPESRRYHPRRKPVDLTGQILGKWTVLKRVPRPVNLTSEGAYYLCRCACGTVRTVIGQNLAHGTSRQCAWCGGEQSSRTRRERRANVPRETLKEAG